MQTRIVQLFLFAGLMFCAEQGKAAVFSLKNVAFQANSSDNYTVSGIFKVNTASGSNYKLTDWNISVNINSVLDGSFTFNNSANSLTPGDENTFTICDTDNCTGGKSLTLTFNTAFNNVYLDPSPTVDAGAGLGNGKQLLGTTTLSSVAYTGAAGPTSLTGQADFVPYSPFFLSLAPVIALSKRLAFKKSV